MTKPSTLSTILWAAPIIASTTFSHFKDGPPAKTWTLKYNLLIAIIRMYIIGPGAALTTEQMQRGSLSRHQPLPQDCIETELTIATEYREKGEKILAPHVDGLVDDWDWQADRSTADPLQASWITTAAAPTAASSQRTLLYFHGGAYYLGTYKLYRPMLGKLALKSGGARVLAVNYRLAPQHPFPTALEDALAAYLYLLSPPGDAPFDPVPASQIVISGDSAGGGLTMALLMVLRDSGLPLPGGAIPISPWVDLTHSLPSCQSNQLTDYLPLEAEAISAAQHLLTSNGDDAPARFHFYAPNRILKHHLVSPLYDPKQWHGLPPLLIQTGDAELLRDESICASFKATNTFSASDEAPPTSVLLDLYQDQPHVFQLLLPSKAVRQSVLTMAEFLRDPTVPTGLTIRAVSSEGKILDVTQDTVARHDGAPWHDWINRLENTGSKEQVAKL